MAGRTTSSAASASANTSMPVLMPRRSQTAASTSVGVLPAPAPNARAQPSTCTAPARIARIVLATASDRFWCPWKPTCVSGPTASRTARIRSVTWSRISAPAESTT